MVSPEQRKADWARAIFWGIVSGGFVLAGTEPDQMRHGLGLSVTLLALYAFLVLQVRSSQANVADIERDARAAQDHDAVIQRWGGEQVRAAALDRRIESHAIEHADRRILESMAGLPSGGDRRRHRTCPQCLGAGRIRA